MRYYIADCHFWHESLNRKMDCRGFASVEDMHEVMIERWNAKVGKYDDVVILGDFSWGNWEKTRQILDRLNGNLHLIRGNHDRFLKDKDFDPRRFVWVKDYAEMNDNKRKVVLSHYPIVCYNGQYKKDGEGNPKVWMLHGHVHNTQDQQLLDAYKTAAESHKVVTADGKEETIPCQIINCFCQSSDYEPLSLDEWIAQDRERRRKLLQKRENGETGSEKRG